MDNRTGVTWGQFQLPILRDDMLHPSKQLTVNNSIVAEAFFPGYSQGVMLDWRGQHISSIT